MFKLFTQHPSDVGETYFEHLFMALGFAGRMAIATFVCTTHAIFPFLFVKTGSKMVADLYQRTGPGRIQKPVSDSGQTAAV